MTEHTSSAVEEQDLVYGGQMPPEDFHECIDRTAEVADHPLKIDGSVIERLRDEAGDLLVPASLLQSIVAALATGHLVLQGPPGTGKSSLARAVCAAFNCDVLPATAHENWSTYEVVGRQELFVDENGREHVEPVNGYFTEAAIQCAGSVVRHSDDPDAPQATWLMIDELNRAHVDRAFGELFSVLGSNAPVPTTLSHQTEGNRALVTPRRFRIVATLNTVDRQFVNSLSQGIRRRFTFLTLGIPSPRAEDEAWGSDEEGASNAIREFATVKKKAAAQAAQALSEGAENQLRATLEGDAARHVEALFDLAEKVRYAEDGDEEAVPHLPIGTAQLIDVVKLFLVRARVEDATSEALASLMDWAASAKLAPLFEADVVTPASLKAFAESLPAPFDGAMKRELLQIAAAGLYYVE